MSIFYIVGKPRGGKSYQAIKALCNELADKDSKRFIVTNLPLMLDDYEREEIKSPSSWSVWKWRLWGRWRGQERPVSKRVKRVAHGLKWFCANFAPHVSLPELRQRIRVLADDETGEFWLYEPGWTYENRRKIKINRRGSEIEVPDFTYADGSARGDSNNGNPGTLYLIDEVHIFFPARAWQRTGEDCTFFLSQHGKLKCDVVMITQHPDQCDKALRNLAQEYMTVRNLSREPILGFRLGNWFRVNRMLNSPKSPNPGIFDSQFVGMEFQKYGDLYDTSAGVGVAGSLVPNVERKGRSVWWLLVPVVCVLWLFFHPGIITRPVMAMTSVLTASVMRSVGGIDAKGNVIGTNTLATKYITPATAASGSAPVVVAGVPATSALASSPVSGSVVLPAGAPSPVVSGGVSWRHWEDTNTVVCVGWSRTRAGGVEVYLSDGGVYRSSDGDVGLVTRRYVVVMGQTNLVLNSAQAVRRFGLVSRSEHAAPEVFAGQSEPSPVRGGVSGERRMVSVIDGDSE
jgi:hypothetical protein